MSRGSFHVEGVDKMDATLTFTMPVKHWKELRAQLKDSYPSWDLARAITEMVDKFEARELWWSPE